MNSKPTLDGPAHSSVNEAADAMRAVSTMMRPVRLRWVQAGLLGTAAILLALHFVHLRADFPNHSPWMDWAKYTDEGWYGDAAIRRIVWGHWNVPGDFNLAAAMPVWSLLEMALFHMTGVSLVAARAMTVTVFGLILVCCILLARRWPNRESWTEGRRAERGVAICPRLSLVPAAAALLLAANPLCYAFSRLAIVEPLLVLLMLLALLAASAAGRPAGLAEAARTGEEAASAAAGRQALKQYWVWTGVLGLLLPLMVLTKTTAVFLFPAVFWMVWVAAGARWRPFLRVAAGAAVVGAVLWLAYFMCFVRPHYLADYQYLFRMNRDRMIARDNYRPVLLAAVLQGMWLGKPLYALALAAAIAWLAGLRNRRPQANPLCGVLLLWIAGYMAFIVYHAGLRPRYYLEMAVPATLLVLIVFEPLLFRALRRSKTGAVAGLPAGPSSQTGERMLQLAGIAVAVALAAGLALDVRTTIGFVRHPEYQWVNAAEGIRQTIEREHVLHPDHSRLVLSISGSDLSLMTGLPSICDDFGTMTLEERVTTYKPGWYAVWNHVDAEKMTVLASRYRLVRVAAFPAFDDPRRNLLILYRLDALETPGGAERAAQQ